MKKKSNLAFFALFTRHLPKSFFLFIVLAGLIPVELWSQATTKVYSTAGTYTFTAPACVTSVEVQTWGAGGAGGGSESGVTNNGSGGGGGGAYNYAASVTVVPGNNYTVVVGAGGVPSSGNNGGNGGASSFNSLTVANGGSGGQTCSSLGACNGGGGAGGTGGLYSGGAGAPGSHPTSGGGGGGGAGSAGAGGNAGNPTAGTAGPGGPGAQPGGSGAAGAGTTNGNSGTAPGGGGSGTWSSNPGGNNQSGGTGADGQVIITYTVLVPVITSITGPGCEGQLITINGSNFSGTTGVTVGSIPVTNLNVTSTVITGTVEGGTTTGLVSVTNSCGTGTSTSSYFVYPAIPPTNLGTQTVCWGDTFKLGGHIYTSNGNYSDTVPSTVTGCDSITTFTLSVTLATHTPLFQSICEGQSYPLGTHSYSASGIYADTTSSAVTGCDSITTLTLLVNPPVIQPISQTICPGTSYNAGGHSYTTAGTYNDTSLTSSGCDSVTILTLSVSPYNTKSMSKSICAGNTYTLGGHTYGSAGTYTDTVASTNGGCDTIVTLTLSVTPYIARSISQAICAGSTYNLGAHSYNAAGTYSDTVASTTGGCDSIITLALSILPAINQTISQSVCPGGVYNFGGHSYSLPGTYADTGTSAVSGCDSITTLTLSMAPYPSSQTSRSICAGGSINFNGHTYTAAGTYADTLSGAGANGCDSISSLVLTVGAFAISTSNIAVCYGTGYNFNGTNYTSSGTYADTLAGAAVGGCDSIATLVLTVRPQGAGVTASGSPAVFCSGDSCQVCATAGFASYLWNTANTSSCFYTTITGTYIVTATDVNGCTAASNQLSVSTFAPTPVTVSVNGDTLASYGAVSYQWYLNGQAIPNATDSFFVAYHTGNYLVEITDIHGCHYSSSVTALTTSVNSIAVLNHVKVYPNPLYGGSWYLDVDEDIVGSFCTIFDADGRVVFKTIIKNGHSELDLNLGAGVYTMQILSGKVYDTLKLIKL